MRKIPAILTAALLVAGLLAGCGSAAKETAGGNQKKEYKDGTYTAKSGLDTRGGWGELKLVIEKGKIVMADYKGIQITGKPKDEEYGKTNGRIENQDFYVKAQNAVKASAAYGPNLVETQAVDKVDAITGATVSHEQFVEAVKKALAQAQK
jgi:major membrane immunogen (membrane-anchored lipoprotein)